MTEPDDVRVNCRLLWFSRAAVMAVLLVTALNWFGWATGLDLLGRAFPFWSRMSPWSALLLAALGAAILAQSGRPSPARAGAGRGIAATVGVISVVFLAEYVSGAYVGLDQVWFADEVRARHKSFPGRPSPQSTSSILLVSIAASQIRMNRGWVRVVWPLSLAAAMVMPVMALVAFVFDATSLIQIRGSVGVGVATAPSVLLLVAASVVIRPDRNPLVWLLARPDRTTLIRMGGIIAGLPVLVALSRGLFLTLGLDGDQVWVLAIVVGTAIAGAATFYLSQRELRLLGEKELLSRERAQAEQERADAEREQVLAESRYRILAENAVDIVVHFRGVEVVWISPSVEAQFGDSPEQWIGSDFRTRIHPDDVDNIVPARGDVATGKTAAARFRLRTAEGTYHWIDGMGKPYIDAAGNVDGVTGSLRVVDDQVEAERQLQRLASFDVLTGLVNRAEAIARFEAALADPGTPAAYLGVLFCDIDHFKDVNDTWGHETGDVVLATLAARTRDCIREKTSWGGWAATRCWCCYPVYMTSARSPVSPRRFVVGPPSQSTRTARPSGQH